LKRPSPSKLTLGYAGILAAALALATLAGLTPPATQIDADMYDWLFRLKPPAPAPPHSAILAIDDETYSAMGGVGAYRSMLSTAFELLKHAHPKAIAVDIILADPWKDPAEDQRLARSMDGAQNLVLAAHLSNGRWENPLPVFRQHAAEIGHDRADELSPDGVTRQVSLEEKAGHDRYWSLALQSYSLAHGQPIVESTASKALQIGPETIPVNVTAQGNRSMRVLFRPTDNIPQISLKRLTETPSLAAQFDGKVVFIGVTSISASYDRVTTPYGNPKIPGVEVHAQLFETLAGGQFLTDASYLSVFSACLLTAILAGAMFLFLSGWPAYLSGGLLLITAPLVPYFAFREGIVFPGFILLASAGLTVGAAASYQHFVVQRALRTAEIERTRYQQAIHFVTHEMRSPLTAIQGSSELMGRYNLTDEKRKQMADMINQESKRLARMIQTFLDIERITDGQMDLKREPFAAREIVDSCIARVRPLAERKNIRIQTGELAGNLEGDRELMEYAVYNLLNNAVKYSGAGTEITIDCRLQGDRLRLSVQDQGIGMDAKEIRQIFQKFYRTKRAEASGEVGTGIGLSIVEQIVHHHRGTMEVSSEPGKGSCFTVVLPALSRAPQSPAVSV